LRPAGGGHDIGADEVAGVLTFPATGILDNFNRANGGLGNNWRGNTNQASYRINNNEVQQRSSGLVFWNPTTFGANQEVFFTFTKVATGAAEQDLLLKVNGVSNSGNVGANARMIEVWYHALLSQVRIETLAPGQGWINRATLNGITFAAGDVFGARTLSDGTVNVYKNGALIGTTNIATGPNPWPASALTSGGKIGVWFIGTTTTNDARFDDFGGGTLP
jgi:hypothetical protein